MQNGYYSKVLLCGSVPMEPVVVVAAVAIVTDAAVVGDALMILESLTVTVVGFVMGPMFNTRRTAAPPGAMVGIAGDRLDSICTGFRPVADLK